jgi:hypothetical protein
MSVRGPICTRLGLHQLTRRAERDMPSPACAPAESATSLAESVLMLRVIGSSSLIDNPIQRLMQVVIMCIPLDTCEGRRREVNEGG